jgi:hypothetical protein
MYYKLYRRRKIILALAFVTISCFYFLLKSNKNKQFDYDSQEIIYDSLKNIKKLKSKITIFNYQEPKPCDDCPGENGQGVFLSVN